MLFESGPRKRTSSSSRKWTPKWPMEFSRNQQWQVTTCLQGTWDQPLKIDIPGGLPGSPTQPGPLKISLDPRESWKPNGMFRINVWQPWTRLGENAHSDSLEKSITSTSKILEDPPGQHPKTGWRTCTELWEEACTWSLLPWLGLLGCTPKEPMENVPFWSTWGDPDAWRHLWSWAPCSTSHQVEEADSYMANS